MSGIWPTRMPPMSSMPPVHSSQVHSLLLLLTAPGQAWRVVQMVLASKKVGYMARPMTAQWVLMIDWQTAGSPAEGQRVSYSTMA